MAIDPIATGLSIWLQHVKPKVENAIIDNVGASSYDFVDPIFTDLANHSNMNCEEDLVIPSLKLEMQNIDIENVGALTNGFVDPTFIDLVDFSDTTSEEDLAIVLSSLELEIENGSTHKVDSSDEEELILPPISVPRSVVNNGLEAQHLGPLELIREESKDDKYVTHICRNNCGFDDENTNTVSLLDALVELGCQCRGSMSRMCIKCLLKWFGPRIMLEKDTTCKVCQTQMNESVKKTVLRALADHTGGREILIEALGPPLVHDHNTRGGLGHMDPIVEEDDMNVNEVLDIPNGAAHTSLVPIATPSDAPPPTPSSDLLVPAPIQQQSRSFWTKFRHYVCCATPPVVLEPY